MLHPLFWEVCIIQLLLLSSIIKSDSPGSCNQLNSSTWIGVAESNQSWCQPILNYNNAFISSNTCSNDLETQLRADTVLLDLFSPNCRKTFWYIACTIMFPPCNVSTNQPIPLCADSCQALKLNSECTSEDWENFELINASWINLNCTNLPTTNNNDNSCHTALVTYAPERNYCSSYPGQVCKSVVDYPVFTPTHFDLQAKLAEGEAVLGAAFTTLAFAGAECSDALIRWSCSNAYVKCVPNVISTLLNRPLSYEPVLPTAPCWPTCTDFLTKCADVIPLINAGGYWTSCNTDPSGSIPVRYLYMSNFSCAGLQNIYDKDFPNMSYTLSYLPIKINGQILHTPCHYPGGAAEFSCISSTVAAPANYKGYIRSISPNSLCELPCLATYIWQENEWQTAENMMYMTFPSFFLNTFMVLTWLLFPSKRKQLLILSFIICIWMISFVLVFSFAAVKKNEFDSNLRSINCKNAYEGSHMTGAPSFCVFQAMILYFFLLSATCWWFVITLDVFRRVFLDERYTNDEEKKWNRIYMSIAWGFPILSFVIFLASGGQLGGSNTSIFLFCFIYTEHSTTDPWNSTNFDKYRDYLLWYGPIGLMGITGFIFMILSIAKIFQALRRTRATRKSSAIDLIGLQLRPILFVLSFFLVFFWFFVWRVSHSRNSAKWTESVQAWVLCIALNQPDVDCGKNPKQRLATWTWYGLHLFLSLQGIILTLTWGTQIDNLFLWREFLLKSCRKYPYGTRTTHHSTKSGSSHRHLSRSSRPDIELSHKKTSHAEGLGGDGGGGGGDYIYGSTREGGGGSEGGRGAGGSNGGVDGREEEEILSPMSPSSTQHIEIKENEQLQKLHQLQQQQREEEEQARKEGEGEGEGVNGEGVNGEGVSVDGEGSYRNEREGENISPTSSGSIAFSE